MLSRKLELNSPGLAAKRSSLPASISTMMRLEFGFLSTAMVAIAFILSVGIRRSIYSDFSRFLPLSEFSVLRFWSRKDKPKQVIENGCGVC